MPDYTTTGLIEALKRRINIPTAQGLYTEADFIRILDEELHGRVVPFYLSQREDFFLTSTDITLSSTTTEVDIPVRAIGQKFNSLSWIQDTSVTNPLEYKMTVVSPGEVNAYGYWMKGNKIVLASQRNSGYLRIYYYRRPAHLASTDDVGVITAIDTNTNTVTVSTMPTGFSTGLEADLVGASIPFNPLADDLTMTVSGSDITFASLPTGLAVGDYVALSTNAPVAQIPVDAVNFLIAASAVRILQGTNYQSAYQLAITELTRIEKDLTVMVTPRSDRDPRKVSNRPFGTQPIGFWRRGARY